MFRRQHVLVSLSVAFVASVLACSSDTQATPRLIFDSTVTPGSHTSTQCGQTGTWLTIGSFGNPALGRVNTQDPNSDLVSPPVPVDDGSDFDQGTVSETCTVKTSGDNFEIAVHGELTGATGGAVTITGIIPNGTTSDATVTMNVTRKGQTFSSQKCIVSFDATLGHAVAAGRVWANIDCPDATQATAQQTCDAKAQFRFENCGQ